MICDVSRISNNNFPSPVWHFPLFCLFLNPPLLENRVQPNQLFLWPIMAMLWGFDVDTVAKRSLIPDWIREQKTPEECDAALEAGRETLRPVENMPCHEDARW